MLLMQYPAFEVGVTLILHIKAPKSMAVVEKGDRVNVPHALK